MDLLGGFAVAERLPLTQMNLIEIVNGGRAEPTNLQG